MFDTIWNFVVTYYVPLIIVYVIGGIIYAPVKWIIQAYRLRNRVLLSDAEAEEKETAMVEQLAQANRTQRRNSLVSDYFDTYIYPPRVSNHKGLLFSWAVFWPFNLLYTLFADVAREAWDWVYRKLGAVLQRVSNAILPE